MTTITITKNSDEDFTVRLRSSGSDVFRELIEKLKSTIPSRLRAYDPELRTWSVHSRALLEQWIEFARGFNARVEWIDESEDEDRGQQQAPPPRRPGRMRREDALVALHLLPTAPPEVIKACHKALALIFHPDRGGDGEVMKLVNSAYDLLMKESK